MGPTARPEKGKGTAARVGPVPPGPGEGWGEGSQRITPAPVSGGRSHFKKGAPLERVEGGGRWRCPASLSVGGVCIVSGRFELLQRRPAEKRYRDGRDLVFGAGSARPLDGEWLASPIAGFPPRRPTKFQ